MDGYREFAADGFHQGRREELRDGGWIRSAGGNTEALARRPEERGLSDARILGGGDFVEAVLRDSGHRCDREKPTVDEILQEVAEKSGISRE